MKNAESAVEALLDRAGVLYLSSVDEEGFPNIRAMLPVRLRSGIKTLYFTTSMNSLKVAHYLMNPAACVYVYEKRTYQGAMLRGTMDIYTDPNIKEIIWRSGDEMYYPFGLSDPDYCVLRFTAHDGRYFSDYKTEDFIIE